MAKILRTSTVGPPSSNFHNSNPPNIGGQAITTTHDWSRPRKHIEAASSHYHQQYHQYQEGGAELSLSLCLSKDDGEVIRQCNSCGASTLGQLSIQTKKNLFARFIHMMERNIFLLQILPWFQTAYNLRLLHQVLSLPGIYSRAVLVLQKYSRIGNQTSLSVDCMKLYQYLASTGSRQ